MITGNKRTTQEYRKLDKVSSSDLRLFTQDRRAFFKKAILKEEEIEEYSRSSTIGNLVHCLLLEPENFDSKFYMSTCASPPTGVMLAFVEALYRHTVAATIDGEVKEEFSSLCQKAHADSGYKLSLAVVMNKFTGSDAEAYYKELRESRTKGLTVVCVADLEIANNIVETIKGDENTGPIFNTVSDDEISVYSELQLEGFEVVGLPMKGMIDKLVVNHKEKTIQIYDLKVMWDPPSFYREYYLKRLGYIQAYVYHRACLSPIIDEILGFEADEYEVLSPIFVVADSSNFYSPILYKVGVDGLDDAYSGFEVSGRKFKGVREIIEELQWCQETGLWKTFKQAQEKGGFLSLKQ